MTTPTFAIIGAGSRGRDSYGGYLAANPERGRVVAVAEPRDFARATVAQQHGIAAAQCVADWRELLDRPRLADAVIIATTDRLHTEPALAACAKGYHVLLEKPMASTVDDCRDIARAAADAGIMLAVCHVLRYAPFYRKIKELIDDGTIGELCSIQHLEGVAWWHFAHSFVRGNFGNESRSSFSLLAKSCHDVDILRWWVGRPCLRVHSFGALKHFRADKAPGGAADCCMACPLADGECPYSAKQFYFDRLRNKQLGWPLSMVVEDADPERLAEALRTGPYGRCVYRTDNDVMDTQIVNFEFADEITAGFTMSAFTPAGRRVRVMGSHGYIEGDEHTIRALDYRTDSWTEIDSNQLATDLTGGHGGGDGALMWAFTEALRTGNTDLLSTGPDVSLESHLMVFAAETSRLEKRMVDMSEY